ncbi:MAG: hypothetical protein HWD62_08300 [Cyclobacteriaceae bacterium]|nr:MAG: hypothetical protein HWD62_08300 [Cyclobacteriaceae bacterium]
MKSSKTIPVILVVVVLALIIFLMRPNQESTDEGYVAHIQKERSEMETFMKRGAGSPFLQDTLSFDSLKFFPADIRYRIKAKLKPIETKKWLSYQPAMARNRNIWNMLLPNLNWMVYKINC